MPDPQVNILLVEDNPTDAELFMRSIRRGNLASKVTCLRDGAEALDYLLCRGAYSDRDLLDLPGVVLLDLQLPKINGKEVLRQIKSDDLLRTIPVVVLTSSDQNWEIEECYKAGANSFVQKPIDFEKFANTAAEVGNYWALLNAPPRPRLGATTRTLVSEVMSRNVVWTTADRTLAEAARQMSEWQVGCLPVAEGDDLDGIVTDNDYTGRVAAGLDAAAIRVADILARPVICCNDSDTVVHALKMMRNNGIRHLPVLGDSNHVVGIISMRDVARIASPPSH